MKISKMTRILSGLSLLICSSTSFSATFIYNIINSSDSVKNPITITDAHFNAVAGYPTPCEETKPFENLIVTKGQEQTLSYSPNFPASCYNNGGLAYSELYITTVDGKGSARTCQYQGSQYYGAGQDETIYVGTIRITELNDRFLCENPPGSL